MSETVAALLGLEQQLRKASDLAQLFYTLVNQAHRCVPYTQALLLVGPGLQHPQIKAVSDLPTVDYTSPYINWAERLSKEILSGEQPHEPRILIPEDCSAELATEWRSLELPGYLLWQPLSVEALAGEPAGALLLLRETRWSDAELGIAQHLSATAGYSLFALRRQQRFRGWREALRRKRVLAIAAVLLTALMLWPVRLSTLAPVEVVAAAPYVVSAPLEGVIAEVQVEPNQAVKPGEALARMEDRDLANEAAIARQALSVAKAELKTVQQSGFMDPRQKARLAELEAEVQLKQTQWLYAQERLARTEIRSERAGVAVLDDPAQWKGRPVRVGERIMLVADPARVEFKVMLPVKDSISLQSDAKIRVFLDNDPLYAWSARLKHAGYQPEATPEQQFAYRLVARLQDDGVPPRIGLRGTAKVYGNRVSLFFYLFRRPLTSFRQWLGW